MKCRVLFGLAALIAGTAANAQAAEVIVHDDYDAPAAVYRHGVYRLAPRDRLTIQSAAPGVYVGSFRPANCGTFHYWDGEGCVDARVAPPSQ